MTNHYNNESFPHKSFVEAETQEIQCIYSNRLAKKRNPLSSKELQKQAIEIYKMFSKQVE